jgi:cell fate regulator YaaT (PSP1 superfamily)
MLLKVTCGDKETRTVKAPDIGISKGDYIIYKTENGKDIGCVLETLPQSHIVSYRFASVATQEDIKIMKDLIKEETEKKKECTGLLPEYNLQMKLIGCHIQFDRRKTKFYFLADTKLDYRSLVKYLSKNWNTRVEFHQIGARDYAMSSPEYGVCGMQTCCSRFLNDFESISTTMLRLQNLACGTDKATGICGKLMCCLKFEENFYKEQAKNFPAVGSLVNTDKGEGTIVDRNFITETVIIKYPDGKKSQASLEEIKLVSKPPMLILKETFLGRR